MSELEYQIRSFHGFLWASGGCYSDFLIHNIDECCWMKDAWPVKAQATGGRHYREWAGKPAVDQNFDHYAVEYTFADGTKLLLEGRTIDGNCKQEFASFATAPRARPSSPLRATRRPARASRRASTSPRRKASPGTGRRTSRTPTSWSGTTCSTRSATTSRTTRSSAARRPAWSTSMGRMAAHTGQLIKWDDILNCEHEFAPNVDKLTLGGPAPLLADKDGKYPVPQPGRVTKQEYESFKA